MNYIHCDYGNKDMALAYVVCGSDTAGKGIAWTDASGLRDKLFYGQPTPMTRPSSSLQGASADSKGAAGDQPHIIFGNATGSDKSYPFAFDDFYLKYYLLLFISILNFVLNKSDHELFSYFNQNLISLDFYLVKWI